MQTLYHYFFLAFAISLSPSTTTFPSVSARSLPNVSSIPSSSIAKNAPPGPWEAFHSFTGCNRGQKYDGLSKLKNYFHHFGYIPSSAPPSTFTDDFDNTLESAIRIYQKNFNLKVTGKLDEDTLQQIMLPRCGVADIINSTTSMNAGKENTFGKNNASSHFHTVSHYTFFKGSPRWPEGIRALTYAFLPTNRLNADYKSAFARALNRWTKVTSFTFQETASYDTANIKVGFFSGDHGDGLPFDGPLGKWAHAFAPTDGRCHFDGSENWVASGDVTQSPQSTAVDLESVAVHEIGHLLGLNHSSVPEAIMYPTLPPRTRKVELTNDDIQGIHQLYRN